MKFIHQVLFNKHWIPFFIPAESTHRENSTVRNFLGNWKAESLHFCFLISKNESFRWRCVNWLIPFNVPWFCSILSLIFYKMCFSVLLCWCRGAIYNYYYYHWTVGFLTITCKYSPQHFSNSVLMCIPRMQCRDFIQISNLWLIGSKISPGFLLMIQSLTCATSCCQVNPLH